MYIQFLIEDQSTGILVDHVMKKLSNQYPDSLIAWDKRPFKGIGKLPKKGTALEQKTGKLLNDLPMYLRAFDKALQYDDHSAVFVVLDNDKRNVAEFQKQLDDVAQENMSLTDHVICVAVKEMEAWLLGDVDAIEKAYPDLKKNIIRRYEQDSLDDTWEILADAVYPGGLKQLQKAAGNSYSEIGKAKCEWADTIGAMLTIDKNKSPSFYNFIQQLCQRITAA